MPDPANDNPPHRTPKRSFTKFFLLGLVVGLVGALAFYALSPKTYESTAEVWVKPDPFRQYRSYFSPAFEAGPLRAKTLKEVVQSLALDQHWDTSREEAVDKLKENISVEETNDSGSYKIRVHSPDPDQARTIASQLATASVNRHNEEEETRLVRQLEALDAEIEDQLQKVADKKMVLAQFASSNSDPSEIEKARLDYDRANSLLHELETRHVTERAELKSQPISARVTTVPRRPTPVSPSLSLFLLLGAHLGASVGLLLAQLFSSKSGPASVSKNQKPSSPQAA